MSSAILDQLETYGPHRCKQLDYAQAIQYTQSLARCHDENFTVVSWLLPKRLRCDFRNIYAFCRWADDLGDETADPRRSLELLAWWRRELGACYASRPRHPVFVALHRTIAKHNIPRQPFDDLINAFVQDQNVRRYDTWDEILNYCTRSANPVGRLVLYVCGYRDERRQALSDATCTALQLANFWQDVRRDIIERDRVYIPHEVAQRHGLDVETMVTVVKEDASVPLRYSSCCSRRRLPSVGITSLLPAYRATIRQLVKRTKPLFAQGRWLWPLVPTEVRVDVALFTRGGESILRMIERLNYNTLQTRPTLSRSRKMALVLLAAATKVLPFGVGSPSRRGFRHD